MTTAMNSINEPGFKYSLSFIKPHRKITQINVWAVRWKDLSTIRVSRKTIRNHSGTKGFKIK
jgi:hypothetical protein